MSNILVIDDHSVTIRVMKHILSRAGYTPFTALSALDGLEILQSHPIALLILDIDMPEIDGITFLRQLRDNEDFNDLPIIMLTASGNDKDRIAAYDFGANGFLTKPVSSAELTTTINQHINP